MSAADVLADLIGKWEDGSITERERKRLVSLSEAVTV